MVKQCTICSKQFASKNTLKQHTGAKTAATREQYSCRKCDQSFCSQRAMEQHRDSATHDTMFECVPCKRIFGSKQGLAGHKASGTHLKVTLAAQQGTRSTSDAHTVILSYLSQSHIADILHRMSLHQPNSKTMEARAQTVQTIVRTIRVMSTAMRVAITDLGHIDTGTTPLTKTWVMATNQIRTMAFVTATAVGADTV
jgi:hypothetical protein